MRGSSDTVVPLKTAGVLGYGIVEPAEVDILTKAVSDYCSSHKIESVDERENVALKVMSLFRRGIADADQLLEELEKNLKRARNATPGEPT
ncbi:MAG: hypothetical protein EOQ93_31690, partial [Mesorhizobium sp.]